MALPFVIGALSAVAGAAGVGCAVQGGKKMKAANNTMELAKNKQERVLNHLNKKNEETTNFLDKLGKHELEILTTFDDFSSIIEKIQGRPVFNSYKREGVKLPEYEAEELKKISAGAGILLGTVGGAAAGSLCGYAAAGATTSAVMAFGTASTGTAIPTLSGAAATNAAMAALGGGSVASGGGGMALGSMVLSGATLGAGLLVGGLIVNVTGSYLSDKADETYIQASRTEKSVNTIVKFLNRLLDTAGKFNKSLSLVNDVYQKHLSRLNRIVNREGKTEWSDFSEKEKRITENTVLLVGLLYSMCQVKLVLKKDKEGELNEVNKTAIDAAIKDAHVVLEDVKKTDNR